MNEMPERVAKLFADNDAWEVFMETVWRDSDDFDISPQEALEIWENAVNDRY